MTMLMTMLNRFIAPVLLATLGWAAIAIAADLAGRARTTDGDTIRLGNHAIRIWGIAAPERSERGGREASAAMAELLAAGTVICHPTGARSHDRVVARCSVEGRDLGAAMVASGWARDCPRYSRGAYAEVEASTPRRVAYPLPAYCLAGGSH